MEATNIIKDYLNNTGEVTMKDVVGFIQSCKYWKEFLYVYVMDHNKKDNFLKILEENVEEVTIWTEIGEDKDSLKFSIIFPNEDPGKRYKFTTYFIPYYDLERMEEIGEIKATLEGIEYEKAMMTFRIKMYDKFSRELRKKRKELETV